MAIPLVQPPKGWTTWDTELCCFCDAPTLMWTGTGGDAVACCSYCSRIHEPAELPSKKEWMARNRLTPRSTR